MQGVVRSEEGCAPIAGAQIEFWMAGPDGQYTDDYRATLLVGEDGAYRFESNFPPPYSGRPPHIHVRVSVEGYQTLITQHYPQKGVTSAGLDLVLVPQP
jgi:protocatechuate 3,4-dioxygenase beta subunit